MTSGENKTNWNAFTAALSGLEIIRDPIQVAKLSQDYHTFSPILQSLLSEKTGDIVIRPVNEAEVLRVVAECVKHRLPLTVRGAGTGNYGQCVPLRGGVILEMARMQEVLEFKPGWARVQPGIKLAQIDKKTREIGWEIRMAPSTYRTATIGGFVGGGCCGIGSITYGQLRDRGNLLSVRIVTLEDEPRVIQLKGDDVQKVHHAYGTNGIITELEIPLAPVYPWVEAIATFADFMNAVKFGQALGNADGIIKKLISIHAWPIPTYFTALRDSIPDNHHAVLLIAAESGLEPLQDFVGEYQGMLTYQKPAGKGANLGEFTWNHTTLHARNADPSLTYLQTGFPGDKQLQIIEHLYRHFGDEVMMHLEFQRSRGAVVASGLQVVRYTTEERLNEIIRYHEENGVFVANPHTYILEDGGSKTVNREQLELKKLVDPYGLLNPGKMRAWEE